MPEKSPIDHIIDLTGKVEALQQIVQGAEDERTRGRLVQEDLRKCLNELTHRMNAMPDAEHKEHHDFIQTLIRESEQRQRVRAAVLEKLASGGAWAGLVGIGTLVWFGVKQKLGIGD
ncbi:hypothetical protein [Marinobacterium lutimaris]|uniref:Uncharacterized protein n=1 Tax=Marinobacterium lutimaris TaxID=568106 RepID=A0A1H5XL66_9GAMM|nr:hypothetical protein [Marinobacterium lutimaris]SEG12097.1 hypothetical protein SAMN05444390_1011414 [Marinobacterium lutimaris]